MCTKRVRNVYEGRLNDRKWGARSKSMFSYHSTPAKGMKPYATLRTCFSGVTGDPFPNGDPVNHVAFAGWGQLNREGGLIASFKFLIQ